jgi:fido (protein-threonine AMPylation protein)
LGKKQTSITYHASQTDEHEPGSDGTVLKNLLRLLFIHPYREGNGRIARLAATMMAIQAGYNGFDWKAVEKRFDEYVSAIQQLNLTLMTDLLRGALLE